MKTSAPDMVSATPRPADVFATTTTSGQGVTSICRVVVTFAVVHVGAATFAAVVAAQIAITGVD